MYLITVIPTHRKLPDGQLSYISKESISIGTIINVPLKKKTEPALVVDIKNVKDEKTYIKSLPWKLISIQKNLSDIKINEKIISVLFDFCSYSLVSPDVVVRNCFDKITHPTLASLPLAGGGNLDTLTITSSDKKLKKLNTEENYTATFSNFLSFFSNKSSQIKNIIVDDPESLSNYGILYLGFDPVAFIVLLSKKLKINICFQSYNTRLRYNEWDIEQIKKPKLNNKTDLRIVSREFDPHTEKQFALSVAIQDVILNKLKENKRILILSSTKSFAPKTICGDCNKLHVCPNCTNPLRLVKNNRNYAKIHGIQGDYIFICTQCNTGYTALAKCINCDSWNLIPLGYGIQRIIENIQNIVPKKYHNQIYDFSDSVKQKMLKDWQVSGGIIIGQLNIINEIEETDICIVPSLGALIYGEFFESVERVRDILHYANNCTYGMIVSVMQDHEKEFLDLTDTQWQKAELIDRKNLHYPPYARHVVFTLDPYASKAERIQKEIVKKLEEYAIPNTVSFEKNILGQIKIHASFETVHWSIVKNDYTLPIKIHKSLSPFMKYLKVEVY